MDYYAGDTLEPVPPRSGGENAHLPVSTDAAWWDDRVWRQTVQATVPTVKPPQRRRILPIVLFLATCCTTFYSGANWAGNLLREPPTHEAREAMSATEALFYGWPDGLLYMGAVMTILIAHEMGHFVQAVRYGVPASYPHFIPMPLTPIGTMGAVIKMHGSQANRRELFDIGLSGPLAGLVIAIPVACLGIYFAHAVPVLPGGWSFQDPLIFKPLIHWMHPNLPANHELALNPLMLAGWVGMLITGLNMMPVSQLDGGHVAYALLGRKSHWLARGVMASAVVFILVSGQYSWSVMLCLVAVVGTTHPPTADDRVPLGWKRVVLGWMSMFIPVLCFMPTPIQAS